MVLFHRIISLAKMIRLFLSKAADASVQEVMGSMVIPEEQAHPIGPTVGLTKDVPFSPMEAKVNTRVIVIQADDAEVDLSIWTPSEESHLNILRLGLFWEGLLLDGGPKNCQ